MNKQIIRSVFKEVLENPILDMESISDYFSVEYVQYVDGKTMHYDDFLKHISLLKTKVESMSILINSIVAEEHIVFTNHTVSSILKNGTQLKMKVIAEFRLRDGKIYFCDELTSLIEGDEREKDLGSRIQ